MLKKLLNWFKGLYKTEKPFEYKYRGDVPNSLNKKTIYIIGEAGFYWQMVMLCPCECGNILYMNLMKDQYPCWSYSIKKKDSISIHPSINRMVGCRSHFFVRDGKIQWA